MSSGANSLTMRTNMTGFNSLIDELADNAKDAIRPASQAAIQVMYAEVQANVAKINRKTGNLAASIYQVYSKTKSSPHAAVYHLSWNAKKAPHAGLVEYGHLQRYKYYKRPDGQIRPMVRPEMEGKPKPGRRASQAAKDAYYVPLPTPIQVPAKAFMRSALDKLPAALKAAEDELRRRIIEGNK